MDKVIHFYSFDMDYTTFQNMTYSWKKLNELLSRGVKVIHTTQMGYLHTCLWELGYGILIHESFEDVYELKEGYNERFCKTLHKENDLFDMWMNGEFEVVDISTDPFKMRLNMGKGTLPRGAGKKLSSDELWEKCKRGERITCEDLGIPKFSEGVIYGP